MKRERHQAILDLIKNRRVRNQEELRRLLARRGVRVTQATLSRDLRELRVVKAPHADGQTYYALPSEAEEEIPALDRLLPHLLVAIDGVQNLLVVRTQLGGAQTVAEAIDWEEWPEVVGTIAGDDTIFILLRTSKDRAAITRRLREVAGS